MNINPAEMRNLPNVLFEDAQAADFQLVRVDNNQVQPETNQNVNTQAGCCRFWDKIKLCLCCGGAEDEEFLVQPGEGMNPLFVTDKKIHPARDVLKGCAKRLRRVRGDRAALALSGVKHFEKAAKNWSKVRKTLNDFTLSSAEKEKVILNLVGLPTHIDETPDSALHVEHQFRSVLDGLLEIKDILLSDQDALMSKFASTNPCLPARHNLFFGLDSKSIGETLSDNTNRFDCLNDLVTFFWGINPLPDVLPYAHHFRVWVMNQKEQIMGVEFEDGLIDEVFLEEFIKLAINDYYILQ